MLSLLDLGYVGQAWKLAVMFKYYSFDLEAVLTCLKLVREICLPSEIDPKVAEFLDGNGTIVFILFQKVKTKVSFYLDSDHSVSIGNNRKDSTVNSTWGNWMPKNKNSLPNLTGIRRLTLC